MVIESLRERQSISELAQKYALHLTQITSWKQGVIEKSANVFERKASKAEAEAVDSSALYAKIRELEMEKEFLQPLASASGHRAHQTGRAI